MVALGQIGLQVRIMHGEGIEHRVSQGQVVVVANVVVKVLVLSGC